MNTNKIPYRIITIKDLSDILDKYRNESSWNLACNLMGKEALLILKKDNSQIYDEPNSTTTTT